MPIPLIPILAGAILGSTAKKETKKQAVSKHTKKNGTKVAAYTRKKK